MSEFLFRQLPIVDKRVHRVGLAPSFGLDTRGVERAFERGINYVYWTPRMRAATSPLRSALAKRRDELVVATGPTTAWFGRSLVRYTERALKVLGIETLDVLMLHWLGVTSAETDSTLRAVEQLKTQGKIRAAGTSIHNRKRAGELARDGVLDLLMIRYNAAHPGAEQDIFPNVNERGPAIVAYTATRWRKLLKRPRGWTGAVPNAGHCYRFCLHHEAVDLVLCGPKDIAQLDENLDAIELGRLSDDEEKWMREFGRVVHGD